MKKMLIVVVVALGLAGCASEGRQLEMAYTAVPLTQTQMAMYATPTETPVPQAVAFAVAVEQARATSAAMEATMAWVNGQMTATAWERDARATAQAAQATQIAFAAQTTATHEAFAAQQAATARAWEATATMAWQGTATAYPATATVQAAQATQARQAWEATATMEAALGAAQATAAYGQAESLRLAVERERATNAVRAWTPWMAFVIVLAVVALMMVRWSNARVVARDAFGAAPIVIMGSRVIDPERMPGPAMSVGRDGVEIVSGDPAVTARAQQVQAIRALPAGRQDVPQLLAGETSRPRIEVVDAVTVRDWVADVERQAEEDV